MVSASPPTEMKNHAELTQTCQGQQLVRSIFMCPGFGVYLMLTSVFTSPLPQSPTYLSSPTLPLLYILKSFPQLFYNKEREYTFIVLTDTLRGKFCVPYS